MPRDGRANREGHGYGDHRARERGLAAVAARRHGVIDRAGALSLGFTQDDIDYRLASGRLHRLHRGVYAVGRRDVSPTGRRLAAVLACGPGAVLSHLSAAAHLGLRASSAARTDVTVPRRSALKQPGVRLHRSLTLVPADLGDVDEVPCTSVARTLLDIAALLPAQAVERAVEQSVVLRTFDGRVVSEVLRRHRGRPGARRLREASQTAGLGEMVTRSRLEELALEAFRDHDLPAPEVNAWVVLGGRYAMVDFLWRPQRVVVETDGFAFHRSRQAFARDRERDRLLELEGWRHLRFTWDDVTASPERVVATVRALLLG